jgi:hypothetical protein
MIGRKPDLWSNIGPADDADTLVDPIAVKHGGHKREESRRREAVIFKDHPLSDFIKEPSYGGTYRLAAS